MERIILSDCCCRRRCHPLSIWNVGVGPGGVGLAQVAVFGMLVSHEVWLVSLEDTTDVLEFGGSIHVSSTQRRCCGIRRLLIVCAGHIPEELGELTKLKDLRLDDNNLTGKLIGGAHEVRRAARV